MNPVLWLYGIGIGINLFHVPIAVLDNLLTSLSQALLLLIMLLIAIECELKFASLTRAILTVYFKLSVGICIGVGVSFLFGFTGMNRVAVVLASSLPSSLLTVVYAQENSLDAQFLATQLSLALPVAIVFSSLLLALVH